MAELITQPIDEQTQITDNEGRGRPAIPYLIIVDGPRRGTRFPLADGESIVGRAPGNHILLEDQSVSRRHCAVDREGETIRVRDLESKNGTNINGAAIAAPVTVGHGDLIQLGLYTLRLIAREVSVEQELEPIPFAGAAVEAREAEGSADTATMEASEIAEALRDEAEASAAVDQEAGTRIDIPEEESPRRVWRKFAVLAAAILVTGLGGWWAYQSFFAAPVGPPPTLLTRVIPPEPTQPTTPVTPAEPTEIPVFLDFASSPMPASVRFLERDFGLTPIKENLKLKVGESFTAEGVFALPEFSDQYTERVTFTVRADETLIPVFFRAPIGVLKVEKVPRNVELSLRGAYAYDQYTQRSAILTNISYGKPIYLPYGRYTLELRRPKEIGGSGHHISDIRYSREILLTEDAPAFALEITTEELESFPVEIHSTPTAAEVFIDTKPVGKTPYTGIFPLGDHSLVLRKEGYLEESRPLQNDINVPLRLDISLRTTVAGEFLNQGRQMVRNGRFQEAVEHLSQVFAKAPAPIETAQAQYYLGAAYLGLKDNERARGYFQQAQQHPDYALQAKLGLVRILSAEQKVAEAIPLLVEVMLNVTNPEVKEQADTIFKEISPLRSVLYIRTEPTGATVYVNDEPMSKPTPVILHDLGLGNYRLRIEHEGFLPKHIEKNLTVHEFNPILVRLEPVPR